MAPANTWVPHAQSPSVIPDWLEGYRLLGPASYTLSGLLSRAVGRSLGVSPRVSLCPYPGRCNLLSGGSTVKNFSSGGRSRKHQTRSWPADSAPGYKQPQASSLPHKPCLQVGIQQRTLQRDHEVLDLGPVTLLSVDTKVLRLNLPHPWKFRGQSWEGCLRQGMPP